jgi:amino acid transporter
MSILRPTFEEARNFSIYVSMFVNMALCQALAVVLFREGIDSDNIALRWSYFVAAASFLAFSGYLAIAIGEITYRFLSERMKSDRNAGLRAATAVAVGVVASAIYLSVWVGAVELVQARSGTG